MNIETANLKTCRSCDTQGTGKYCGMCGQTYETKRISLSGLLHDVFHFFTHLEKGFGYTLKQLIVAPGTMQRMYIDGVRAKNQKPFSMFFICASVNAVGRYWIYEMVIKYYHVGDVSEASFFHQYMVVLYAALLPLIALITWLFFYKTKYNYAEVGVLQLYQLSFIFLAVTVIALLKFIWPALDTAYVELPLLVIYSTITLLNFFNGSNKALTIIKSIVLIILIFLMAQYMEDTVMSLLGSKH